MSKDATEAEIRSSYRKLARKWHPDRNPDKKEEAEAQFKRISKAYEVLTDAQKRKIYDQHGEAGLEGGMGGGGGFRDPMDIFGDLFGFSGMGGRGQQGPKKTEDLVYALNLSLREFYKGKVRRLQVTKDIICHDCKGSGSSDPSLKDTTCTKCNGSGSELRIMQPAPGVMQQFRTTCTGCQGQGSVIPANKKCKKCNAAKVIKEKVTLEVNIRPGMKVGEKIVFYGDANQAPGYEPGDIVLVLKEREATDEVESRFERRGDDLWIKQTITLSEALCGYRHQVHHLDDRIILLESPEATVTKPGDIHYIEDEGMPSSVNPALKGFLVVQFDVQFPIYAELSPDCRTQLLGLLPAPPALTVDPSAEHYTTRVGSAETTSASHTSKQSDHDHEQGGSSVRCAQQ